MSEFEIDKYKPEYYEQVIQVLKSELWSFRSEDECRRLFQWKYLDNPFTETAAGCVAKYEGRVVSFFGLFIQEYRCNDDTFLCAVRSDASTLPEFQGKGIFKKLTRYSLDFFYHQSKPPVKYILALSSNEASSAVYKKSGWQEMGKKQMLYNISLGGMLRYLMKSYPIQFSDKTISKGNYIINISNSCIDYSSVKQLLPQHRNRIERNITDAAWRWRYKHPLQQNIFCTVMNNGIIKACIVLQRVVKNRFVITDYFFEDEASFRKGIKQLKKHLNFCDIQAWAFTKNEMEIKKLRNAGFMNLELITKYIKKLNAPPALIRPCKPEIENLNWIENNLDIRNRTNWYLNPCDSDIY
jgi:hypothetical protein